MGCRDDVGPGLVQFAVNGECGKINRPVTDDHIALVIDANEIANGHQFEIVAERIHPKPVRVFRVAHGDVTGNPLSKVQPAHRAQTGGQPLFAMQAFCFDIFELDICRFPDFCQAFFK